MKLITDKIYANAKETQQLILKDFSYISFTPNFKYLGSWISYDLTDSYDILCRITKANKPIGALKFFWQAKGVDVRFKYLIYMVIPLNILLWRCESWALTKDLIKKNDLFHITCLRRILGIKWSEVVDDKISNKTVCSSFNNIRKVEYLIAKTRLLFVGKIIRMARNKISARLISAFIYKKRPRGRLNTTVRHSISNDIRIIIPSVDKNGAFKTWDHIARNELLWSILVNNIVNDDPQPCIFSPEWDEVQLIVILFCTFK